MLLMEACLSNLVAIANYLYLEQQLNMPKSENISHKHSLNYLMYI